VSLESNVVRRVKKILESKGAMIMNVHGSAYTSGHPDIFATFPMKTGENMVGVTVVIECKQPGGKKPRPQQFETLAKWKRAGAIAIWTDNPDEVLSVIRYEMSMIMQGKGFTTLRNFRPIPELTKGPENASANKDSTDAVVSPENSD
jgi:Holliday junction resolvase